VRQIQHRGSGIAASGSRFGGGHSSQPIQQQALTFVKQPPEADPDRRDAPQSGTGGDQEHDG